MSSDVSAFLLPFCLFVLQFPLIPIDDLPPVFTTVILSVSPYDYFPLVMHLSTRLVLNALLLAFTNPSALAFFTNDTRLVSKNTTVTPSSVPLEPSDTPSFSKNASLKLSGTLFNSSKKASSKLSGTLFNSSNIVGHSVANTSFTSTNETSRFLKQSPKSVYYVWPINSTNKLGNEAILNFFQKELGLVQDEIPVSRIGSDLSSVNFFTVEVTADEAGMVANSTEVSSKVV